MTVCAHSCISEPLPWFVLEQYKLGDLDAEEVSRTEDHLAHCSACSEVFDYLAKDDVALPPLPAPIDRPAPVKRSFLNWKRATAVGVAAAAAVILVLALPRQHRTVPKERIAVKGGDLALSIVKRRGTAVQEHPTRFEPEDRFRLMLTSPFAADLLPTEVAVFQGDEVSFPYPANLTVQTGNRRSIDGAFSLSGNDDVTVCVAVGDALPTRDEIIEDGFSSLPETTVCLELFPAY